MSIDDRHSVATVCSDQRTPKISGFEVMDDARAKGTPVRCTEHRIQDHRVTGLLHLDDVPARGPGAAGTSVAVGSLGGLHRHALSTRS